MTEAETQVAQENQVAAASEEPVRPAPAENTATLEPARDERNYPIIDPSTPLPQSIPVKFALGQQVRYVRINHENVVEKGVGRVVAALLDHTKRPVYQLKDGDKVFNIDEMAIDADEAQEAAYQEHYFSIRKYTEEANAAIRVLTEEANAEIEKRHTAVLGAPLSL